MLEDVDARRTASERDLREPAPRHRRQAEPQVERAPVHGDERARTEPLVDVERTIGIDVDALVDPRPPRPVVPDRHHPADRQQRRRDRELLADVVEHAVIREVDVTRVMDRDLVALDHVADALRRVALAPPAVVVAGRDRVNLEPADRELIAGGDLGDPREPEVRDDVAAAARYDEVRLAWDRLQAPAIEVIDVRVRDEHGIDRTSFLRTPRQQRIEHDARTGELCDRGRVAQPRDTVGS